MIIILNRRVSLGPLRLNALAAVTSRRIERGYRMIWFALAVGYALLGIALVEIERQRRTPQVYQDMRESELTMTETEWDEMFRS